MTLLGVQQRLTELGRIRTGEKGSKGEPKRLTKFRLTSASRPILEAAAKRYGGTVRAWQGAPDDGYWELYTEADALDILIPPTSRGYSQAYELWTGGTAMRRCDGETEMISGAGCLCDPEDRECQVTTRVQVMLPDLPGLGVWRVESHGWNAAAKLPATIELLRATGGGSFVPAVLRLVAQSKRVRLPNGKTQTHRWMEPEIDTARSIGDLLAIGSGGPIGPLVGSRDAPAIEPGPSRPPRGTKVERPELGPAPALPATSDFRKPDEPRPTAAEAPAMASGWAVDDRPAAAEPVQPVRVPPKGSPEAVPPPPVTYDEFKVAIAREEISHDFAAQVFKRRFPTAGKVSELDDDQRGRLLAEITSTPESPARDALT